MLRGATGAAPDRVDAVCDQGAPELVACRRARIEQDKALLTLVRDYRAGRMQSLQAEHGKSYAQSYARHQDLDHSKWREYRDARCATQSREQAVPVKALPASVELCRYEWARDQLRRYKDQMARLGEFGRKIAEQRQIQRRPARKAERRERPARKPAPQHLHPARIADRPRRHVDRKAQRRMSRQRA